MEKDVKNEKELRIFQNNLKNMEEVLGQPLYNFKRKLDEGTDKSAFGRKFEQGHKAAFDAAQEHLPSCSTLRSQTTEKGSAALKRSTVEKIAQFCSEAFMFDEVITGEDLLTRRISFPELYRTGQWGRYVGIYRCFYIYPDPESKAELHGGLLKLWEESGKLRAFFVTGLRKDRYIQELEEKIKEISRQPEEKLYSECQKYNRGHSDVDMGLVMYQGVVQMSLPDQLLMQLQRCGDTAVAVLALHRRDKSALNHYSGGIASVTLCRETNITSYPMAVTRHGLTLVQDRDFMHSFLRTVNNGEKGLQITHQKDSHWNRAHLDRLRDRSEPD